jgi:hypothetical protein
MPGPWSSDAALRRLRELRNRPERDLSMAATVATAKQRVAKRHRDFAGVWAAWSAVVPARLAHATEIVGVSRGVLTVRAADTGVRFEIDRLLRSGGETELVRRAPIGVRRVKLVL